MTFIRADFHSKELDMSTSAQVLLPDDRALSRVRVVYLLHGLSDNCTGWLRRTAVERYAQEYGVAVVMPEVQRSFYTDMKYGVNYFSYVYKELPEIMHRLFSLPLSSEKSYVMGLSMGGYGAMKCMLTDPDRYAGCAAFSSVADLAWSMQNRYDEESRHQEFAAIFGDGYKLPESQDLFLLAKRCAAEGKTPRLFLTCGESDSLREQNERFVSHLNTLGFAPYYEEWPGDHTWEFWDVSIKKAFDYFFSKKKSRA